MFLFCFNLAIERLFISGESDGTGTMSVITCFNLAIEMLFISGQQTTGDAPPQTGFNLAIEMLFISGVFGFANG